MIHDLTPDLIDPMLLAQASVPSLHEVIGLEQGKVALMYDPTIRKPVRLKPDGTAEYDENAKRKFDVTQPPDPGRLLVESVRLSFWLGTGAQGPASGALPRRRSTVRHGLADP